MSTERRLETARDAQICSRYLINRGLNLSRDRYQLIRCPACDETLENSAVASHIASHDPEDFGLTPIGERRTQR